MTIDRNSEEPTRSSIADERRQAIVKARAVGLSVRQRADRTEQARCVPTESIQELLESGLFGILKPRVFGGAELGVAALVDVTAELSAACGSTGWVYGVLAGHSWMVNLFPVEAQREIFDDANALIGTVFRLGGEATPVDGGYRLVNGEGGLRRGPGDGGGTSMLPC